MRTLAPVACLTLSFVACEPKVEEPTVLPTSARAPASVPEQQTSGSGEPSSAASSPRCQDPWPEAPLRAAAARAPVCPAEDRPQPPVALGAVRFPGLDQGGKPLEVAVEIARSEQARSRGLMFRTELAKGSGMLFVFESERILRFWMKNTCVPLDMIFLDEAGFVVGVEENTPTLSEQTFGSRCPARYVLEVPAGYARELGIKPGVRAELPSG